MSSNNPSAFPSYVYGFQLTTGEQVVRSQEFGMSLRDWFAGMAMQGLIGAQKEIKGKTHVTTNDVAEIAYDVADAMLEQRTKNE